MAQPADWLGALAEQEVCSVIAWKRAAEQTPEVKVDHDGRFSDDGSNFRSVVAPSNLSGDSKIQIRNIISIDNPITLVITDGFTCMRAKLSERAASKLEDGIEQPIDFDLKGDILRIREATIESTPYGPSEGFVQLAIEDLEYLYHLRKLLGHPVAVENRSEIQRLVGEITALRCPLDSRGFTPYPSSGQRATASRTSDIPHRSDVDGNHKSPRSVRVSQPSSPTFLQSPSTQRPLATQIPARHKPPGPTLSHDGLEIENGVNLSRPVERRIQRDSATSRKPAIETKQLLSLLGKRKAEPANEPVAEPSKEPEPVQVLQSQIPTAAAVESRMESPPAEPGAGLEHAAPAPQSSQPKQTAPVTRIRTDYRMRKIPRDQQKLLDRQSSWLPSLPGQHFPHPNVPIELLNRWKSQAIFEVAKSPPPQVIETDSPAVQGAPPESNYGEVQTLDSSSSESSSEDEDIPESQWPASPEQQRPLLPPDSSLAPSSGPSPADKQAGWQPPLSSIASADQQNLSEIEKTSPTAREKRSGLSSSQSRTEIRAPKPLPVRSDWVLNANSAPSPVESFTSRTITGLDGATSRPSTSEGPAATTNSNTAETSPQGARLSMGPSTDPNETVVKGIQASKNDDDDGMEMVVPRSLGQDPAFAHRERRREHFQAAQRRSWLSKNVVLSPDRPSSFFSIYNAYKKAHERDAVQPSEFAAAISKMYPTEGDEPPKLKLLSSDGAQNVRSSPAQPHATPTTDTIGAVATSTQGPSREAVKETPLRTSQPRRSLPWAASTQQTPRKAPRLSNAELVPASTAPGSNGRVQAISAQRGVESFEVPTSQRATEIRPSVTHTTTQMPAAKATAPTFNRSGLSTQPHRPVLQPSNNGFKTPQLGQNRSITTAVPRQRDPPPAVRNNLAEVDKATNKSQSTSVFAEFARAYRALEPGGAFAEKRLSNTRREKRKAPMLDVLSWEL